MKVILTEVYSRVSGYFRPVTQWNKGKKEEFSERQYLNLSQINMERTDEHKRITDR
jgi:hypothetical protein